MKTLGLFRHAKSDWTDARARDFDRPLNERGQRGARLMGQHIKAAGYLFARVIASPAVRVAETIELAGEAWGRTFAVEWEPNLLRFFVDGQLYQTLTPATLPAGSRWVFDHPFFLLLNVAVGGEWPGDPDATTTFPQVMVVDYVRVYLER